MLDTQQNAYIETRSKADTDREKILHHARTLDFGFTNNEMAEMLGMNYFDVQPRISELVAEDKLKDSGVRRIDRKRMGAVWEFNPEPKPKPKKMKPIGDKKLWGEMMQKIYAQKAKPYAYNQVAMERAAVAWAHSMAKKGGSAISNLQS
jgi:hypothetical protein